MIERRRRADRLDIVLRPNRSATRRQLRWWLFGIAATAMAVSTLMAALGAWPVAPLAGAEVALLAALCRAVWRRAQRCQRIRLSPETVDVWLSLAPAGQAPTRMRRDAASVDVSGAGAATRVALSDRRRRVGVGEFLSPPDIERLLCALADGGLPLRRAGPRRQLRP